MLKNALVS